MFSEIKTFLLGGLVAAALTVVGFGLMANANADNEIVAPNGQTVGISSPVMGQPPISTATFTFGTFPCGGPTGQEYTNPGIPTFSWEAGICNQEQLYAKMTAVEEVSKLVEAAKARGNKLLHLTENPCNTNPNSVYVDVVGITLGVPRNDHPDRIGCLPRVDLGGSVVNGLPAGFVMPGNPTPVLRQPVDSNPKSPCFGMTANACLRYLGVTP